MITMMQSSTILTTWSVIALSMLMVWGQPHHSAFCDTAAQNNTSYQRYFTAMEHIYSDLTPAALASTCLPVHSQCGWPATSSDYPQTKKKLPLLVFSIGLEGAGHHLWTEILQIPVFDCVWINGRHYYRGILELILFKYAFKSAPDICTGEYCHNGN